MYQYLDQRKTTQMDCGRALTAMTTDQPNNTMKPNQIHHGDNLRVLPELTPESIRLIYIDPPFNTGIHRHGLRMKAQRDSEGDRIGFGGNRYRTETMRTHGYADQFEDYLGFLMPRIEAALPLLTRDGSLLVHLDQNQSHYVKVALDQLMGQTHFMNEIIWAYDFGGRSKNRWPAKHDTILWYARNPKDYVFDLEAVDRIPYMAPGLVGQEKAQRGKTPTDVWWHTIVPTNGKERTGYPTQKPLGVLNRFIQVHTQRGDRVLDFFAGSGTTGQAAGQLDRQFDLIDQNPDAIAIMRERLKGFKPDLIAHHMQSDSTESAASV